jgi:mannan polymerase II complex MNN10 subunit
MLNGSGRYIDVPKHELVNVCVSSLVNSINQVYKHDIELVVIDDHSTPEAIKDLEQILWNCKHPAELINLEATGIKAATDAMYDVVEARATDLWYHIEDDYLHFPEAIEDMIDSVDQFEKDTGKMVAINPHDDVWRYTREIYSSFLLLGPHRHYRTVKHTTYTCLASRACYDKYKKHFRAIATPGTDENSTINLVWNQPDVLLFSPIPGLAFHIMTEDGKDKYIDINKLWDSVPKLWVPKEQSKIAIISMYNDAHKDLGEETWPNKEAYAKVHGYEAYCKTDNWTMKPIHFEKLVFMLDVMKQHPHLDWVWWMDNDSIITNYETRIEDIVDNDYHVIITVDHASLNAGSFVVRNTLQGRGWLEHLLSLYDHYKDNRWPEQQPMTDTYISFEDIIKVLPQRVMNSYDYKVYGVPGIDLTWQSGQWEPGDFVLHWPALPNQTRIALSKQLSPHHRI